MSVNKIILVGYLGKDPEIRKTPSGATVASFTLATNEFYTDKLGERQTLTEWHNIVAWSPLAEICGKYLNKGKQVYVGGRIEYRTYEDRNGIKRSKTEIIIDDMEMIGKPSSSNHADGGSDINGYEKTPF